MIGIPDVVLRDLRWGGHRFVLGIAARMEGNSSMLEESVLSPDEVVWAARFRTRKRWYDFLEGRRVAKHVVDRWVAENGDPRPAPSSVVILPSVDVADAGRPQVRVVGRAGRPPGISISHWPHGVAALAGIGAVGVDGEEVGPRHRSVIMEAFGLRERRRMERMRRRAGWSAGCLETLFWTAKEAYLKLCGCGLRASLTSIEIVRMQDRTLELIDHGGAGRVRIGAWFLRGSNWMATACVRGRGR